MPMPVALTTAPEVSCSNSTPITSSSVSGLAQSSSPPTGPLSAAGGVGCTAAAVAGGGTNSAPLDLVMSPEQEASPPPAAPGAAPVSPSPTQTRLHEERDQAAALSDVEQFAGKIVYNPDGSAYIIEDSVDSDAGSDITTIGAGGGTTSTTVAPSNDVTGGGVSLPQLHAVYVSRLLAAKCPTDAPAVHSYRVVSLRDAARPPAPPLTRPRSVPVKPILMCFVCKLSFGYARSFAAHAQSEHGVTLQESERDILASDCSAILQLVGAEKKPLVSLLEPLGTTSCAPPDNSQMINATSIANSLPIVSSVSSSSNDLSSMINTISPSQNNVSQNECMSTPQSLVTHARRPSDTSPSCPTPTRKSPPITSSASPPFATPSPAAFLTGTTIGVCPEHIQGRPSGVECQRCEMILASGRLGTPAGLTHPHSRNSCKTLKCPKCNWHYKYQETLEIHMKEKHPEAETSCIYCIAGQPHPRLARGETYTCGYKPYRCEVCNYSTTTKGNLSIHMQSDKHLNNMQELQNGGGNPAGVVQDTLQQQQSPKTTPLHHSPVSSGGVAASHKPKPTFRCDVCNYETNVARNLRIHMTSEKHTHNMLVLQQNVKHMQTLSAIHHQQQQSQQQHLENLFGSHFMGLAAAAGAGGDKPEAALADMAYNQALLIQMMTGGQIPGHLPAELAPHLDMGLNPETMEPPPEPADPNPEQIFTCCVCNAFSGDSLEALGQHLARDRTKTREQEILALVAGHYVCKLCTYKTNLKANFQLHCKTDKHLQRLQHVNHVKEGGPRNEWRLKYVSAPGGVQVRCNACDYYTNSAHKLQLHAAGPRHEAAVSLFRHLSDRCRGLRPDRPRAFLCALCAFSAPAKLGLLQHVRSMKHMHMEQLHQLQKRQEGQETPTEIGDVFQVVAQPGGGEFDDDQKQIVPEQKHSPEMNEHQQFKFDQQDGGSISTTNDDLNSSLDQQSRVTTPNQHMCPYCNYSSNSELRIQAHLLAQHSASSQQSQPQQSSTPQESTPPQLFLCPLCQDSFKDRISLERHVMQIHSVNSEGLQRLLMLVDQSHWLNQVSRTPTTPVTSQNNTTLQTPPNQLISPSSVSSKESIKNENRSEDILDPDLTSPNSETETTEIEIERCSTCLKNFRNIDELCIHQNETGHLEIKQTPSGPGYFCWKKGCSQFFPTAQTLQNHFKEVHARNSISQMSVSEKHVYKYRCNQCSLAFKTLEKLQLHSQYHLIRDATKCVLCGRSFRSIVALAKHVESVHSELSDDEVAAYKTNLFNNPLLLAGLQGHVLDPSTTDLLKRETLRGDETSEPINLENDDCKEPGDDAEENNSDDSIVYKEQQFLEDYLNSQAVAEDGYGDPARKYKCHRCRVAFTRQSYLTAHNKTLLHRKGEKLSYPMEKYLDPNRPYKCDVCKESFTQKNILLVHYNSVSHLHKLKRAMQEHQNNNNNPVSPSQQQQQQSSQQTPTTPQSQQQGGNSSTTPKSCPSSASSSCGEDDEKKRYRCNICKVAYSQGSTLDIHMRSVLHQTRASKLQDLAMSGQIDLSRPLVEQPSSPVVTIQAIQQQLLLQDQQQQLPPSTSISSCSSSTTTTASTVCPTTMTLVSPGVVRSSQSQTPPAAAAPPSPTSQGSQLTNVTCQKCGAIFTNQDQLYTHQQVCCTLMNNNNSVVGVTQLPQSATNTNNNNNNNNDVVDGVVMMTSPLPGSNNEPDGGNNCNSKNVFMPRRTGSQMFKHLLESFGFDLVMQYNENHQRRQRQLQQQRAQSTTSSSGGGGGGGESGTDVPAASPSPANPLHDLQQQQQQNNDQQDQSGGATDLTLPEVSKSTCQHCNKEFSSVWVLKSHCEEIHKDLVPLEFLEKYAQQIKNEYERKSASIVVTQATSSSSLNNSASPRVSTPGVTVTTSTTPPNISLTQISDTTPDKDLQMMIDESKEVLHSKLNIQQTPPEGCTTSTAPSTPTSSTTPASSTTGETSGLPANIQAMLAQTMAQNPIAFAQQMSEMQAALNVMQLQQQLNFNPMVMSQMMGMGLPLGLNALAAMNLQPPLVPLMMPPPPYDPIGLQAQFSPQDQQAIIAKQQAAMLQQQQQQAVANAAANQKRARTRITDDQLKILRAHFDINNSPSEDQIHEMAAQSGLPPKVIKHWFRNTLFKERQRNKDSPYNFNNPPSTTLNLEEYEKTGEAKVMPLNTSSSSEENTSKQLENKSIDNMPNFPQAENIKTEPKDEPLDDHHSKFEQEKMPDTPIDEKPNLFNLPFHHPPQSPVPSLTGSENQSIPQNSRPNTPNSLTLTSIISSQLGPDAITTTIPPVSMSVTSALNNPLSSTMLPPKIAPQNFASPNNVQSILPLTPNRSLSPNRGDFAGGNSNGSTGSTGSTGKRANRTRFTDYQIKVLQEFFENNAYPKDDDLEYLSKLLSLSPRVIVVWFQNARQKARKVYENQPAVEPAPGIPDEAGANRFQRTPGLNYQCKKCLLVFQRYYELIRHQKTHCFKEEDAKRSAQAQAAAAQIAAVLSSEDSNSSTIIEQVQNQPPVPQSPQIQNVPSQSPIPQPAQSTTPTPSGSNYPTSPISTPTPSATSEAKEGTFQCDKCNLVFPRFDLWREHQLVHIMNPNLFPTYPPDSPFGILQQHAQLQQLNANLGNVTDLSNMSNSTGTSPIPHPLMGMLNSAAQKRKFDEYDLESDISDQPKDKRLRTTILPEQLDYLYQKYQIESNPSRKMLENIAREVGLKKRVVQVWFQNTRARERKGQFRAHAQVINKRCPFCPALFKVKSALESHLTTKHADQCARGEINIDALPDEELSMESAPSFSSGGDNKSYQQNPNMMPPSLFPPFNSPEMENSIKKYYEESMKRYISELQMHAASTNGDKSELKTGKEEGDAPLDLSKPVDLSRPMKVSMDHERSLIDPGPLTDLSERSLCDERSDSMSETTEFYDDESNPTSPASSTQSNQQRTGQSSGGGGGSSSGTKRFRTQMSSLQVKVMKSLFNDYKTPTMAECEMLGREIGLPKRVVQVWFQNARAKEKKNKIALQKLLGGENQQQQQSGENKVPEDCKYCQFKYSHKFSVQDHIFTKSHIANVKMHLEAASNSKNDNSGNVSDSGEFQVPPVPCTSGTGNADSTTTLNNNTQHLAQMQLLQMAGLQMAAAASKASQDGTAGKVDEGQEALFQQLYALGSGAAAGFPGANQFLHPAMFGASVGTGGLLLDTGVAPGLTTLLPMPPQVVEQVTNSPQEPGVTTVRIPEGTANNVTTPRPPEVATICREVDLEVCFVCKKCKVAFTSESNLLTHQRQCFNGNMDDRGSFRIVQSGLECKICPNEKYKNISEFKKHIESEQHLKCLKNGGIQLPPPSESPLSHEMEDVVNQITLLAARAAQETNPEQSQRNIVGTSGATGVVDSNSNTFCQPTEPKRRFLNPQDITQPLTSAGH